MDIGERYRDALDETLEIFKKYEFDYQQSIEFLELLRQALIITHQLDPKGRTQNGERSRSAKLRKRGSDGNR